MIQAKAISAAMLLTLAACAPAPQAPKPDPHDVQATQPGKPTCYPTTAAQNAAGASATNQLRRARGLDPLTPNATLAEAAARHACDMAERGMMSHSGSRTAGPAQRVKALGYAPMMTAENIAAGPFSQQRVLAEWSRSGGHIANIVIPQMRDFGIGRAIGADGKTVFWAAVYGAPR